jgi:predicted DNA-binding transcriptional regulator AlpA
MIPRILRYPDLKSAGIVGNRATLYRWIRDHGFPRGFLIGPNSRGWPEDEVLDWLENRRTSKHCNGCELDVIPPDDLRAPVQEAIEEHLPADELVRLKRIEDRKRETLMQLPGQGGQA